MLQLLGIYLLKVTCISGLLFLYYHIALRNKLFHYYNRFYLLCTFTLSIALPLLQLEWFTFFSSSPKTIHLYKIIYGNGEADVAVTGQSILNPEQIVLYALALISFSLLLFFCIRIARIYRLKKNYPFQRLPGFDFITTDIPAAPFSFLKNIFWRNDISMQEETGKQILQHEITHIQQKHSWDKLYVQLLLCFYWLNPFFHLAKKELYVIHEFIADEKAVKHSGADAFAKMLLTAQFGKFNFLPGQSIFYSPIKRRLVMLTTSKKPQFSYARRLMTLPVIAALVCLFAFTIKTKTADDALQPVTAAKPFVLVVDAGHGGKDNGAVANGLYEKDIVLKIAQKIKDLSSEYGIAVILTRNSDVYMSPSEKSYFANGQNADALVSIHVNSKSENSERNSGLEVYISKNNMQEFSSVLLGSAILQNLQPDFKTPGALSARANGIWILKNSIPPAALIECGYLTNDSDAQLLKNEGTIELIAKNILKGVVLYANNKNSIDPKNVISAKDTIPSGEIKEAPGNKPLYVLNGKIITEAEMKKINPTDIESMNVLKDRMAIDKYGDKGKNGVVEIITKDNGPKKINADTNINLSINTNTQNNVNTNVHVLNEVNN